MSYSLPIDSGIEPGGLVRSMSPMRFALWLFMIASVMIFGSLSSALIVKRSYNDLLAVTLPPGFYVNLGVLALSSLTLYLSRVFISRDRMALVRASLWVTFALGVAFLYFQLVTFGQLVDMGIHFVGNPAGSFIYVLMGVHGAHLVAGLVWLLLVIRRAHLLPIRSPSSFGLGLFSTFWHFLSVVWLYLLVFLTAIF